MNRPIDRATALLAAQHGVAHVAQLRRAGVEDPQFDARVRSGSWVRVAPDVVAVAGAPRSPLRTIWQAVATTGFREDGTERPVAVGGAAAAYLLQVVPEPPRLVEVVTARGRWCPRVPGVRVREVRDWPDRAFVRLDGLLVTAPPDTLVDLARHYDDASYLTLLQDQCYGRFGLLGRVLGRCHRGHHGSARARRVAVQLAAGIDSALHARALDALREAGLAPAACSTPVVSGVGPSDCVYVADGRPVLALEFDGDVHRLSRKAFLRDRAKDLALGEAGCATLRFTVEQVARPEVLTAHVRRALSELSELTVPLSTRGVA